MSSTTSARIETFANVHEVSALWWIVATVSLTTIHHLYGAIIYHTPWRDHAAIVAVGTVLMAAGLLRVHRSLASERIRIIAFWMFVILTLLIAVVGIGLFEGGYNHGLKNLLYFTTTDTDLLQSLFPSPTYEMPNDAFFEITGVLQFPVGLVTGWKLVQTVRTHLLSHELTPRSTRA
jgi:hypothetical protein